MKSIFLYSKSVLVGLCLLGLMGAANGADSPASIPHSIEAYEISSTANACVMCHRKTDSLGDAQDISASHYVGSDGKEQNEVSSSHYTCTTCHTVAEQAAK